MSKYLYLITAALVVFTVQGLRATPADAESRGETVLADSRFGELSGRVTDAAGAPLADVSVFVIEISRGTVSGADGRYSLPRLPAGAYRVSFSRTGYAPEVRRVEI
ncbi:carboxypeptidase-like regulatory domain-containing protein, partial [bacterium]|nr:carboxypeptidase-like regulatory domain-containing protein [bacterium]